MHLDIDGTGGAFMTSLWQLKRFEARISLFKSLDCPLALAAAVMNQRFTRYPPVINHNLGWCNANHKYILFVFFLFGINDFEWILASQTPLIKMAGEVWRILAAHEVLTHRFDSSVAAYIDGLAQGCSNSSALAMELLQSCTKPSKYIRRECVNK